MLKSHSKSIRLNDRVYNYILNYEGDGFNQKFENIILYAMESELKRNDTIKSLDEIIDYKLKTIRELDSQINMLFLIKSRVDNIIASVKSLEMEVSDL